jgi:FKBP-type peptidyl-prolyl cis-trans isomerase FklB
MQLRMSFICALLALATTLQAQDEKPAKKSELKTVKQKVNYGVGLQIGRSLARDGIEIDSAALVRGIIDAVNGTDAALTPAQIQAAFGEWQKQAAERRKLKGAKSLEEGKKFLAANAKKKGVVVLKSGLQYEVIRSGKGATPTATDTVTTHYQGKLISGKIFDGSYKTKEPTKDDEPISFPVGGVIAGWTEALKLMKVGDKWRLFIPSELAYAERGAGSDIGPNSVLVFEIELLGIKK